jgi:Heat induced stress protein YflT domain
MPTCVTLTGGARATYEDFITAQRAVDLLSDDKFPVDQVSIVGEDVRLVERVLGRWTVARGRRGCAERRVVRVADRLTLRDLRRHRLFAVILVATTVGALWGAAFGAVAHALTGG